MTKKQNEHLDQVVKAASALIRAKYKAGQKKHSGNLFELTPEALIDEAIMEAIDQLVYLLTAKSNLEKKEGKYTIC